MPNYNKNEPDTIQHMFNSIASNYDKTNAVLSFQLHKRWNRQLIRHIQINSRPHHLLDLCCGTGDIALDYLKTSQLPCQAFLVDFCSNMLTCAKAKMEAHKFDKHQVHYTQADVQSLPFSNATVDCATMAYGIRNVKDPAKSMQEVFRVLKPGGKFGILELTQPQNSILRLGHQFYLRTCLPILGKWLTSNQDAYQYLQSSIQSFIAPDKLEQIMRESSFIKTERIALMGGIATILIGTKPLN
jgi:demethylmenaquinone methyltransferase/2-methoxy-6-polyprenyl-1,4-benzoquinol methylase